MWRVIRCELLPSYVIRNSVDNVHCVERKRILIARLCHFLPRGGAGPRSRIDTFQFHSLSTFLSTSTSMSAPTINFKALQSVIISLLVIGAMSSTQESSSTDQGSGAVLPSVSPTKESAQEIQKRYSHMRPTDLVSESLPNYMLGDDDEPMVYETPRDYATSARKERDWLISMGADPDSVILQSEVCNYVPQNPEEPLSEYGKRYVETMKHMIQNGVMILNDLTTGDVEASGFGTSDGRRFNLGPGSGATKGDFRAFTQWFHEVAEAGGIYEVPERWSRFEEHRQREQGYCG